MTGVDCFVVCELVVTDVPEVVSVEVCTLMGECAVKPVFGIPVLWCAVEGFRGYGSVRMRVLSFLVEEGVDRGVGVVEVVA